VSEPASLEAVATHAAIESAVFAACAVAAVGVSVALVAVCADPAVR